MVIHFTFLRQGFFDLFVNFNDELNTPAFYYNVRKKKKKENPLPLNILITRFVRNAFIAVDPNFSIMVLKFKKWIFLKFCLFLDP